MVGGHNISKGQKNLLKNKHFSVISKNRVKIGSQKDVTTKMNTPIRAPYF